MRLIRKCHRGQIGIRVRLVSLFCVPLTENISFALSPPSFSVNSEECNKEGGRKEKKEMSFAKKYSPWSNSTLSNNIFTSSFFCTASQKVP